MSTPINIDTPEGILHETLVRLNNLDEADAERVVRALCGFIGMGLSPLDRADEEDDDVDEE